MGRNIACFAGAIEDRTERGYSGLMKSDWACHHVILASHLSDGQHYMWQGTVGEWMTRHVPHNADINS